MTSSAGSCFDEPSIRQEPAEIWAIVDAVCMALLMTLLALMTSCGCAYCSFGWQRFWMGQFEVRPRSNAMLQNVI